jgi:hypothetical protein
MVAPDAVSEEDIDKLIIPDDLPDEPSFKAYIEAKVYDKEGHIIDYRRQPMRSLTQYFLALMSIPLIGTYQSSSTDAPPAILTNALGLPNDVIASYSANIVWDWSIQVGSGTQAFSPTLTSLAAPIANGTGVGQLEYGATMAGSTSSTISITTTVNNSSGGFINVTEIGLQGKVYIQYYSSSSEYDADSYTYLLSYDTFSPAISLPSGGVATFQIVISFTG